MGSLLAIINTVTDYQKQGQLQTELLGIFILSCATFLLAKSRALNTTARVVEDLLDRTRVRLADRIRRADLSRFEAFGKGIEAGIARDMQTLSEAGTMIIHGASSGVMLVFSALYVAFLSQTAFLVVVMLFGSAIYFFRQSQRSSAGILRGAIQADSAFYDALAHLLGGIKEVKLSTARGADLQNNYLVPRSAIARELRVSSSRRFNAGTNVTNLFFYLLLGILVFVFPHNVETSQIAAKVISTIIFVGSAIEIVLKALPMMTKANMALETLDALERNLLEADEEARPAPATSPRFASRIECRTVSYSYFDQDGKETFNVGPLDLEIRRGETLFVVGGNGSGKTTLIRLLARLYEPRSGVITWDGRVVDRSNLAEYRNLFGIIFADFHLFDRLYGMGDIAAEPVEAMLADVGLGQKTRFEEGRFTNLDLSTGQRKRLALVGTLLEDRPIWIFDELAADQAPDFRHRFYEELLPAWKALDKTLIIVTHDDRYFGLADRLISMEEGHIIRSEQRQ